MSKNALIPTNTIWYKIYVFFRKRFFNNYKNKEIDNSRQVIERENDFEQNILKTKEIKDINNKRQLAKKLMDGEINIDDLTDVQINEMIIFFKQYINEKKEELDEIKSDIIKLQKIK